VNTNAIPHFTKLFWSFLLKCSPLPPLTWQAEDERKTKKPAVKNDAGKAGVAADCLIRDETFILIGL